MRGKSPLDNLCWLPDAYMQLCVPQLEPSRSDLRPKLQFVGTFLGSNDTSPLPEWFRSFVVDGKTYGPLLMVTSGTIPGMDVSELIIPTSEACRDLPVRLVVCAVHASKPENYVLPDNVRWAEWISFDELFKYTDIAITNGGYGGIDQAFANGIPMVLAGCVYEGHILYSLPQRSLTLLPLLCRLTEDKAETTARAEMTGAAINLRTHTPTTEQVREAIKKMVGESKYKQRALVLKQAYAECDAVGSIVKEIHKQAESFYGNGRTGVIANGHA
ncbi:glycosyltransferase family 1 protein [Baudoinia panamericana UAMH 10762]|uniref:Glycosyltransferase family 1 protein n=1 Tax=Baudoinia panamericana (strain UAMH 10762) TaxID=717646 RepID=M2NNF6_BAUPA|nr:glycosyltransferase family 1 protein [Baudoinia panamericana UAMH 10762]EMD00771.1 glycosyltransferase family 1 protein [Baudoinia panamericana UAMH 10762]